VGDASGSEQAQGGDSIGKVLAIDKVEELKAAAIGDCEHDAQWGVDPHGREGEGRLRIIWGAPEMIEGFNLSGL